MAAYTNDLGDNATVLLFSLCFFFFVYFSLCFRFFFLYRFDFAFLPSASAIRSPPTFLFISSQSFVPNQPRLGYIGVVSVSNRLFVASC